MNIDVLIKRLFQYSENEAVVYKGNTFLYKDIIVLIDSWAEKLRKANIRVGNVVAVIGGFSPEAIALLITLIKNRNIIVPLTSPSEIHFQKYFGISQAQFILDLSDQTSSILQRESDPPQNNLILNQLIEKRHSGLVLFTSGSTGEQKAVVHDFEKLMGKFLNANKRFRTLCFLMFDHIAGLDTCFYTLFSGGTSIFPASRNPGYICQLIEDYNVEVLPVSPTFLNLLLLSEEFKKHDLSSIKILTFGSETMPSALLARLEVIFNKAKILQKYGITELGSPASRTKENDSSWIKISSNQFKTKVIDGTLFVKADTAMVGYLNAPDPFTEDGWFNTGDAVEVDGEYIKFLGRKSAIINVGGEKVYPAEVENVILQMENVAEVVVYGERNAIIGNVVCASINLLTDEDQKEFSKKLRTYCRERLEKYKIPVELTFVDEKQHSARFKKRRTL